MEKLEIGKNIYLKTINNEARGGTRIIETKIETISKKYFTVSSLSRNKFRNSDLLEETNFSQNYVVYFDKQEILDELESIKLYNIIRENFQNYAHSDGSKLKVSLEQLRKISEILETN